MARLKTPHSSLGPLKKPARWLRRNLLPPVNFITIHYAYFMATCMLSAIILWASATPFRSLRFIDALFLSVSAMTEAGLNTVNLSSLNTFQQVWLFLQIILGSAIFVSTVVVHFRKAAFKKKFQHVLEERERKRRAQRVRSRSRSHSRHWSLSRAALPHGEDVDISTDESKSRKDTAMAKQPSLDATGQERGQGQPEVPETRKSELQFRQDTVFDRQHLPETPRNRYRSFSDDHGVGVDTRMSPARTRKTYAGPPDVDGPEKPKLDTGSYLDSIGGWIGRNSQMYGLTEKEREQLGGYEYRALKFLSWLVPTYFLLMQFFGALGCAAWIAHAQPDTARQNGLNPWWVGAFNAVSAFNNSGMSLLDANMTAFQTGYYLLVTMGFLILAGYTCYPIFLRLIVWSMWQMVSYRAERTGSEEWQEHARTLQFLLDHPRRCYTNLFPRRHTYWLLAAVITLNGIDWAAFEILNIGNEYIEILPTGVRVVDGLFQAFAVRSGGFYVVPISRVRISLQVLYVVMMYISAYPVAITMRNSNVYEERSLGIYAEDEAEDPHHPSPDDDHPGFFRRVSNRFVGGAPAGGAPTTESNGTFVRHQLRAQLANDMWTVVTALFLIMIIETGQFDRDPGNFSVFNFLFEIVSGYGCVGISIGIPWADYSFCGTWHTLSKLVLCVVMLRGRHRGLPVAIDKAIALPGEGMAEAEEADARIRLARTISRSGGETV